MNESKSVIESYYTTRAAHGRQLNRLVGKPVCKWKTEDFEALTATGEAYSLAVAKLDTAQKLRHVDGLTKEQVAKRLAEGRAVVAVQEVLYA